MKRKLSCWLGEDNLAHNFIWYKLYQNSSNKKCGHWPNFTFSASVKRLCCSEAYLFSSSLKHFHFMTQDILNSGNILHIHHKLCLEVKASPTNGYLLALIYITYLLSEELIKQHNITKIKDLVHNLQQSLKKSQRHMFTTSFIFTSAVIALICGSILTGYL